MKLYPSAYMEGVACVSDPTKVDKSHPAEYGPVRAQMTAEVAAAWRPCAAPDPVWSGHRLGMVQELDTSFDGLAFVGYHLAASGFRSASSPEMRPCVRKPRPG